MAKYKSEYKKLTDKILSSSGIGFFAMIRDAWRSCVELDKHLAELAKKENTNQ